MRARRRHPPGSSWREHLHSHVPMKPDPGLNWRASCSPNAYRVPLVPSYASSQTVPLHDPTPTQAATASSKQWSSAPNYHQHENQENNPQQLNLHSPKHCWSWGCPGGAHSSWAASTDHPSTAPQHQCPQPKLNWGEVGSLASKHGCTQGIWPLRRLSEGTLPQPGERAVTKQGVPR